MTQETDLAEAVGFHGHLCPGLAIGYRASKIALEMLRTARAEDEDLVAIVENDSCSVDAVQWVTGCTFGKGNLVFRDYGKQVFTFAIRPSGRAVRISLKPNRSRHGDLAVDDREARVGRILTGPVEEIFDVREITVDLPMRAQIHDSVPCETCGEEVMSTRTVTRNGRTQCIPCSQENGS